MLRAGLRGKRLRLSDDGRHRLAAKAQALGREALTPMASVATPATLVRWYRYLIAAKYDGSKNRSPGRPPTAKDIRELIRIQGISRRRAGFRPLGCGWRATGPLGYARLAGSNRLQDELQAANCAPAEAPIGLDFTAQKSERPVMPQDTRVGRRVVLDGLDLASLRRAWEQTFGSAPVLCQNSAL